MYIDSHAHLQDRAFHDDQESVITRAIEQDVKLIIVPGTDLHTSRKALALHHKYPFILPATGFHPHDAKKADPVSLETLEALLSSPEVAAVGEIGLDYHYNFSSPEVQKNVLRVQLRMACRAKKPVILHSRESQRDLLDILDQEKAGEWSGVVHCFSGTVEEARAFLDRGFYLGFTGIITYRKADDVRGALCITPPDRILVETDSPYLAPLPHRGKRNEPAYIPLILEQIAALLSLSIEQAAALTDENTRRLFGIERIGEE
jgi:TatD DNase family protein